MDQFGWAVVEYRGQNHAGPWTMEDDQRLRAIVSRAHALGLWVRFYTLNGHPPVGQRLDRELQLGSLDAARQRMHAARDAGVEFIASDQYEELGRVLSLAPGPPISDLDDGPGLPSSGTVPSGDPGPRVRIESPRGTIVGGDSRLRDRRRARRRHRRAGGAARLLRCIRPSRESGWRIGSRRRSWPTTAGSRGESEEH